IPSVQVAMDFAGQVARGRQEGRQEGEQIGETRGVVKGEAKILQRQLQKKFGTLPAWVAEKLTSADSNLLELWGDRILDAVSIDEIFDK
ncbi:DUF4351 domain-containing protein, partial [Magnetococcales bacterium HHB-1]